MKLCCVFNYNPLYRFPIYNAMSKTFDCDFFFGDTVFQKIKTFNANDLKGFKSFIKAKKIFLGFVFHSGISQIFNKKYTHYILTGNPYDLINWLVLIYAKFTSKKVYLWCHGIKRDIKKTYSKIFNKLFFKSATGILLYGKYNYEKMVNIGCNRDNIYIIHNSLDTDTQSFVYKTLAETDIYKKYFHNIYPTIIYIGRIQKRKKIDQILQALSILKKRNQIVNLIIVGADEDFPELKVLIKDLDLVNQIWIYGPCYNENTNAELIYNAVACVSPGNIGLTCIHSLSYGTPVITNNNFETQMPEFEAIIDGETGSFYEENNICDLAEKILYWASISDDKRKTCRNYARNTIEQKWSVMYQIEILKNIIN